MESFFRGGNTMETTYLRLRNRCRACHEFVTRRELKFGTSSVYIFVTLKQIIINLSNVV